MPMPDLSVASLKATLKRLQGRGAYTADDDTARVRELEAIATAASESLGLVRSALDGIFPGRDTTDLLLEEWERYLRIVEVAGATNAERRSYVRGIRSLRKGATAASLHDAAIAAGAVGSPEVFRVTRDQVTGEGAEPESIFRSPLSFDDPADLAAPKVRERVVEMLLRILPSRAIGRLGIRDVEKLIIDGAAAAWESAAATLNRTAIGGSYTGLSPVRLSPARVVDYGPQVRIDAEDLNAIQDAIMWRGQIGGLSNAEAGGAHVMIAASLANGASTLIDTSIDWRDRYIWFHGQIDSTDLRPGAANDDSRGNNGTYSALGFGFYASGSASVTPRIGTLHTNVDIEVNGTGQLLIRNNTGSTRYIVGMIMATGRLLSGTPSPRYWTYQPLQTFDSAGPTRAQWLAIRTLTQLRRQNQSAQNQSAPWASWAGDGGLRRYGWAIDVAKPATTTAVTRVLLDASEDWRDRLLKIECIAKGDDFGCWPGVNDDAIVDNGAYGLRYTGVGSPGTADGATVGAWQIPLTGGHYIYADTESGALYLERKGNFGGSVAVTTLALLIHATEPLGVRAAAQTARPTIQDVTGTGPIASLDFNSAQDGAVLIQMGGFYRREAADSLTPGTPSVDSGCFPLGPVMHGDPPIPVKWRVRERVGDHVALDAARYTNRRQPVAGMLRIPISAAPGATSTVTLDSTLDWRDRLIRWHGRHLGTDIRPGGADVANHNTGTEHFGSFYSGPGGAGWDRTHGNMKLKVNATTGALELENLAGSTQYVTAMVEATFQAGPRS